ncbi:MAG: magnesium transporter [Myxococcota bacterium]|nr:magnesium transporter [Myxococcota bacterium]
MASQVTRESTQDAERTPAVQANKLRLLHEGLRRYLRQGAVDHMDKLIAKTRDEELAAVMAQMGSDERLGVFERVPDDERRAHVITLMAAPFGKVVLEPLDPRRAADILREMAPDDQADILADLEEDKAAAILEVLEASEEVEDLMRYGDDTAGGIMIPEYLALHTSDTAEEALGRLRESGDVEMVYYVYVLDDEERLVGVLSLRKLVTAPPQTTIQKIMATDVICVHPDTDQEEVARLVARYSFLSIPVVDEGRRLLGLVTVDDVIDVLREEATEDILKMVGAGDELVETQGIRKNVKARLPWLLASVVGGLLGAGVMGWYNDTIEQHEYLAFFLPLILGMSGNVGTQAATVTVRALAVGRISHLNSNLDVVYREVAIGLVMGVIYGILAGVVAWSAYAFFATGPTEIAATYGLAVGLAFIAGMMVASAVGAALPIVLSRMEFDPAVATGPFVTTSVDILGIAAYFGIASALMDILGG